MSKYASNDDIMLAIEALKRDIARLEGTCGGMKVEPMIGRVIKELQDLLKPAFELTK